MQKFFKTSISILLLLMLLMPYVSLGIVSACADNPVRNARNSVVRIVTEYSYRGALFGMSTGTGICVGTEPFQYLITNKHVVDTKQNDIIEMCHEILNEHSETETSLTMFKLMLDEEDITAQVYAVADNKAYPVSKQNGVAISSTADLALLHLDRTISGRSAILLGDSADQLVMDTVYALGYPALADVDDEIEDVAITSGIEHISATNGIISRKNVVVDGVTNIQHTANISHGNSGGPLVNEQGVLIGVNTWSTSEEASSVYFAIDVEEVKAFLRQNNVNWLSGKTAGSGSQSYSSTPVSTPQPTKTPAPVTKTWSSWSSWSTKQAYSSSTREVETRTTVKGYNMFHYRTQYRDAPYPRVFRDYSINGDYDWKYSRRSYGEKYMEKYVTADQLAAATTFSPDSRNVYNGNHPGYQDGTTIAYGFKDDEFMWFIRSKDTVTEYRYRDLK